MEGWGVDPQLTMATPPHPELPQLLTGRKWGTTGIGTKNEGEQRNVDTAPPQLPRATARGVDGDAGPEQTGTTGMT